MGRNIIIPGIKYEPMAPYCVGEGDYVSIPVGGDGLVAIVDIEDEWLTRFRWSPWKPKRNHHYYAVRGIRKGKRVYQLHMPRFLCGALPGERVWHVNGDPLMNRKTNLLLNGISFLDTGREKITEKNFKDYLSVYI